ncbi:MAG: CsbD family protein [Nocardioides sp.]|nr:CsbD family protein [Nocardioides sp.]
MGLDDKAKHQAQDTKGKAKEATGAATGNRGMKAKGRNDQNQAKAKEAGRHVKQAAKDTKDSFKS